VVVDFPFPERCNDVVSPGEGRICGDRKATHHSNGDRGSLLVVLVNDMGAKAQTGAGACGFNIVEDGIVIDAAYMEFEDEDYTDLRDRFDKLILLPTLSKALGGAGLRMGFRLGAPALTESLAKLVPCRMP